MRYLSACAILRDEALYIAEWIEFHLSQGVEHFYLYNNESKDNIKEVLLPYKDIITWHELVGFKQQKVAYNHCIDNYTNATEWCMFLDIDEFIFCTNKVPFAKVLKKDYDLEGISGLVVHWILYGSGGELEYQPVPVRNRFIMRNTLVNPHVKSIMRMQDTVCMGNDPHSFRHRGIVVNELMNEMPLEYAIHYPPTADKIRINHYYCKSKAEHRKRKTNPDANSGVFKDIDTQFAAHDVNDIEDKSILCL